MKFKVTTHAMIAICLVTLAQSGAVAARPEVTAPPDSFFEKVRERDRQAARLFYRKHVDVKGLPVAAAAEVADLALQRTCEIVTHMLAGRPDILKAMVDRGMYLVIIGKDQVYTDLPENRNARNPDYLNERVRGTGGLPTSFGEENLLSLPIDRYDDESIAVHEFCHTIDSTLRGMDPTWRARKEAAYENAVNKGLYKDTYAIGNSGEYWAEIAQAYFDCNRVNNWNHGPIGRREHGWLQTLPNVETPAAKFNIDPYYTKFTWAREFAVLGRQASDEALIKANDTIRKMFAYRHDILKTLIADGVKLLVLGPAEALSDLPEYGKMTAVNVDHTARFLDYSPETKLLVVAQENVLADPGEPYATECQVIRVFATAGRPVDPNWENRGRQVQQYELRVQRMDIRFDKKLEELYDSAMSKGQWKGTAAVHDRIEYWTQGVLAYFGAVGQGAVPNDADHPITTRESLSEYDPGLFELVAETMAYEGKVDWRYRN